MAFLDEGTPRWEDISQGGTGTTAITGSTDNNLLVVMSKAPTDKYKAGRLTNAATDDFGGVTAGQDSFDSNDPYELKTQKMMRVKTSEKLRVRTATAYTGTNYGQKVVPDATSGNEGFGSAHATNGKGFIVGGETVGSHHYLDFWLDESDQV